MSKERSRMKEQVRACVARRGRPLVVVPVMPRGTKDAAQVLAAAGESPADLVEWRADHLADPREVDATLEVMRESSALPVLATVRTTREGGEAELGDDAYLALVLRIVRSDAVAAVDVEAGRGRAIVTSVVEEAHRLGVVVVGSHHDFTATPREPDIVRILERLADTGVDVAKYACMARDRSDVLALLGATSTAAESRDTPLVSIAMGPAGALTRVVGGVFGSVATFAHVGAESAPGQLPAEELIPVLDAVARWSR